MAISRAVPVKDAPYLLCMDGNVTAEQSIKLRNNHRLGNLGNVWNDRNPAQQDHPTFKPSGIADPLVMDEAGTSAIDFILTNDAASVLINDINLK